mmetsp:Transcript_32934/g.97802  ORF Transcript_32934/g.97802 Transcript_32934/m.97802 type:complete len:393 (-) Transcript_32934:15-1193(-)
MSEELRSQLAVLALLEESCDLLVGDVLEVELNAIAADAHLLHLLRDLDVGVPVQALGDRVVALVVLLDALLERGDLRADHRGGQAAHAQRVVRDLVGEVAEDLDRGHRDVALAERLIGAGVHGNLGGHEVVVREEEAALSRVQHLVRLRRDAGGDAVVAAVGRVLGAVTEAHTDGVRAVLEQDHAVLVADPLHLVHVGDLAAHVRDHEEPGARGPGLQRQVLQVQHIAGGGLHIDRLGVRVVDGRRHGDEGERVRHDLVAGLDAGGQEHEVERGAARVKRHAVLVARVLGHLHLAERDRRLAGLRVRVAVHLARLHELAGGRDARRRHRVGGLDVLHDHRPLRLRRLRHVHVLVLTIPRLRDGRGEHRGGLGGSHLCDADLQEPSTNPRKNV